MSTRRAAPAAAKSTPGDGEREVESLSGDFASLRGEALKTALAELGAQAAQSIAGAQHSLGERAAERSRLLAALKTASVKRQLEAVPGLDAHAKLLIDAEARAASEDKKRDQSLKLLQKLAASALGRGG